ncbi:MAG: hypothetical protein ACTSWN_09075 [Promethearchaeota archaeon]
MEEIIEHFKDELKRIEFKYLMTQVRVVVLNPVPELEIHFNEGGPVRIGPFDKNAEIKLPIWIVKILKAKGFVVIHRDERPENYINAVKDRSLVQLPEFFYNKTLDWIDSVEKLHAKGLVPEQTCKLFRSQFITFITARFRKLLDNASAPSDSFLKKLSEEEVPLAKLIQTLLNEWENVVMKKEYQI